MHRWRPELAFLDRRRSVRRQHRQFFGGIGPEIGFRALYARVAEPKRDFPYVAGRCERMHGATVAKHLRRHVFVGQDGCVRVAAATWSANR